MMAKIKELWRFPEKAFPGDSLSEAKLIMDIGMEGDFHKGGERQVSILSAKAAQQIQTQEEKGLCFRRFKANILVEGMELRDIKTGSLLYVGDTALKIIAHKRECFDECVLFSNKKPCPLAHNAAFASVKQGGVIRVGDSLTVIEERYSRNIKALSAEEVELLHHKKVCVIGCGGLGGYVIESLARMGVGHITVVDYDVFEPSNMNRQLLATESLIGVSKAEAAEKRIAEINSLISVKRLNIKFEETNGEDIIKGHDVVMDALDNINTRRLLAHICNKLSIPLVHGSIGGWYGQVASIFPGDGTMEKIYRNAGQEKGIESTLGNLPFTASAVASLQCAECIKILTGKGELLRKKVLQLDLLDQEYHVISITK